MVMQGAMELKAAVKIMWIKSYFSCLNTSTNLRLHESHKFNCISKHDQLLTIHKHCTEFYSIMFEGKFSEIFFKGMCMKINLKL